MTEAYETTWLDDVLEESLTLNSTTNQASTKPLSLAWLKGKGRWPDYAEQKLEGLMVQYHFFNYQKTNGESVRKMWAIVQEMRSIFDTAGWIDATHDDLLMKKIQHKLGRIRGAMRVKGELDDGLVYQSSSGSAISEGLFAFEGAARKLAPAEVGQALQCLGSMYGRARILEEVAAWDLHLSYSGSVGDLVAAQQVPNTKAG